MPISPFYFIKSAKLKPTKNIIKCIWFEAVDDPKNKIAEFFLFRV
jgi:hypothetical protein